MGQHRAEPPGALAGFVRHDPVLTKALGLDPGVSLGMAGWVAFSASSVFNRFASETFIPLYFERHL